MALLLAGLPVTVPGETVNRLCASGMSAVAMPRRARASRRGRPVRRRRRREHDARAVRDVQERDAVRPRRADLRHEHRLAVRESRGCSELYGIDSMGQTAENVAEQFRVSREDQDAFAVRSQQKAAAARERGPVRGGDHAGRRSRREEGTRRRVRRRTSSSGRTRRWRCSAKLRPAFRTDGQGSVTAGNSSGINDGACAVLVASDAAVREARPHAERARRRDAPRPASSRGSWAWARCRRRAQALARAGLSLERYRRDRAQRGVRGAGAGVPARARRRGR